jgi:hypothetical protein
MTFQIAWLLWLVSLGGLLGLIIFNTLALPEVWRDLVLAVVAFKTIYVSGDVLHFLQRRKAAKVQGEHFLALINNIQAKNEALRDEDLPPVLLH